MAANKACCASYEECLAHGILPDYLPAFIGRVSAANFWYHARISSFLEASWQLAAATL
jgi:hypothetical protein